MGERGFTLLDVLVGMGILLVVTGAAAVALTGSLHTAAIAHAQQGRLVGIDAATTALQDDAASAVAIGQDAAGTCSTSPANHVVMVSGRPGAPAVRTITYAQSGGSVTRTDSDTGATETVPGLTALSATCATGDKLGSIVQELAGITTTDARMRALPQSNALGGTVMVNVSLSTSTLTRDVHLTTAIAPSGFTVKGNLKWHAVLWRVDQTHRFWFGFAGKSHYWIYGGVWVTYDNWATSQSWCSQELYHDSNGDYNPHDSKEQAVSLFAYCKANVALPAPGGGNNPFNVQQPLPCILQDGSSQPTCPPLVAYTPPATHATPPARVTPPCTDGGAPPAGPVQQSARRARTVHIGDCTPTDPPDPNATPHATATPGPAFSPSPCFDYISAQTNGADLSGLFNGNTNTISVNGTAATLPSAYATYHWTDAAGESVEGVYLSGSAFSQVDPPPANSVVALDMDTGTPRYVSGFIPVLLLPTDANGEASSPPLGYVCVPES